MLTLFTGTQILLNWPTRRKFDEREQTASKYGFQYKELESGILYAEIGPKNNIITFIVPHFADRLPLENFVIYDEKRDIYAVHPSKMDWYLVVGDEKRNQQERIFSPRGEKNTANCLAAFFIQ